jgi:hypothetical protein
MTKPLLDRILRESGVADLLGILGERLAPTDLQSLLLEVYRRRAAHQTPAGLLEQYERNRFARPSAADPCDLVRLDGLAFLLASPPFEPIELSPVCPLGTNSVVAPVDQNITVVTIRNSEVVSDSTNVLALECAVRRRSSLRSDARSRERVKLCASHRLVRAQNFNRPGLVSHFRLFALCTAGRDEGSYRFELESLYEQIAFYVWLLSEVEEIGHSVNGIRVAITDLTGGALTDRLRREVMELLAARRPGAQLEFDPDRTRGRGYYEGVCFSIHATDARGAEHELADGGFTPWTQRILSNQKERLLISGISTERMCSIFR